MPRLKPRRPCEARARGRAPSAPGGHIRLGAPSSSPRARALARGAREARAMAARIPGPFLQQTPIGFPSYCRRANRDWGPRKLFQKSEVNTRIYKAIYENIGVRGTAYP
ncbi:unnamed protein product [Prorocentrum cordatum]|uniref:Uncharacterized protein n=1 Tax=Prorocentrum cordatum TaxID=2364126 RepID=A0ABN9V5G4_9DINO|nr:unnamed protein product [Polarella glacialis]